MDEDVIEEKLEVTFKKICDEANEKEMIHIDDVHTILFNDLFELLKTNP